MNLERRSDPFRRPARVVVTRRMNAGSASRIDGSDWPARTGSVLPSLDRDGTPESAVESLMISASTTAALLSSSACSLRPQGRPMSFVSYFVIHI